jgi:hypothetical protein
MMDDDEDHDVVDPPLLAFANGVCRGDAGDLPRCGMPTSNVRLIHRVAATSWCSGSNTTSC